MTLDMIYLKLNIVLEGTFVTSDSIFFSRKIASQISHQCVLLLAGQKEGICHK